MVDLVHISAGLDRGVKEIGLETVERLDAEIEPVGCSAGGQCVMRLGALAQFRFGAARAGEMTDRRMDRSAQAFGAQRQCTIERPIEMLPAS